MSPAAGSGRVLTVNGGSSSVRFAVFARGLERLAHGRIERIGLADTTLCATGPAGPCERRVEAADHAAAASVLIDWLAAEGILEALAAVGHRVVHGMGRTEPQSLTPELLAELERFAAYDPEHLPREIALMRACAVRLPRVAQIACFDTAFHSQMPPVARRLPLPRRYAEQGLRRYGFHGLSYAYLCEELARLGDPAIRRGRVILAHLGSGASMAAVLDGRGIDTTMGFTPASGLVMGTRSGDLDPGIAYYFARSEHFDAERFQRMVNHESGLLGVSSVSPDVRDLLAREAGDAHAAEALELFCYQARKTVGALAAALGGLDTLVFSGGIGENAAPIRARICAGLEFLGLRLDPERNRAHAPLISAENGAVRVRVLHTDEERMIARAAVAAKEEM
ncbi:MAG: acetate/propionate family kinase [Gammaproteobacteria bacterium]|nr:acetate/propionate family kinase [Gammaproteobacteria bacterium]